MLGSKCMEMITYQDKLFWVYRRVNKNSIKEGHVLEVRDFWHCDTVLKTKGKDNPNDETLLFLVEISDAEIVEHPEPSPAAIAEPSNLN